MNWRVYLYEAVPSTNLLAVERIQAGGAEPGDVYVAGLQTEGHGRRGRTWEAGPGALLLTAVLPTPASHWPWMGMTAALAVAEALHEYEAPAGLKWPNDVVLGGGKVAGVASEEGA